MPRIALFILVLGPTAGGCVVKSVCYEDPDCPRGQRCELETGQCVGTGSGLDDARPDSLPRDVAPARDAPVCDSDACVADADPGLRCPADMVPIDEVSCIDIWEASRPDATETNAGKDGSRATSRPSVLPWQVANNAEAQAACEATGKDLCTETQWQRACGGAGNQAYAYGKAYDPVICNGIDRFCRCTGGCADRDPCPFGGCYHTCGADFSVLPTGRSPECRNAQGALDLNGNLWEHVKGGDATRVRGGAYNCSDSQQYHRCDYIPGVWSPLALGFRCCLESAGGR